MIRNVLHLLSQRPSLTGSGITLEALVRHGTAAGWTQRVLVAVPATQREVAVGGLAPEAIHTLRFPGPGREFPVPGMSDVMPYESTRFASLDAGGLALYRSAWTAALRAVRAEFAPALIHAHHTWILGSLVKTVFPDVPLVLHGHGTDLRQMELCPHLAEEVIAGCRRCDGLAVLHGEHARRYGERLGIEERRIHIVGSGYDEALFCGAGPAERAPGALLYAGKLSRSKGLPQLLDTIERLASARAGLELHVAGGGHGTEADELRARMARMPRVHVHGRLEQPALAALMRRCAAFVLPSFYEGLPLVLVEALASGCRLVATALPGIAGELAPRLGEALTLVPPPRLIGVDTPRDEDLPAFVEELAAALDATLERPALAPDEVAARVASFTWREVFQRVERLWRDLAPAESTS